MRLTSSYSLSLPLSPIISLPQFTAWLVPMDNIKLNTAAEDQPEDLLLGGYPRLPPVAGNIRWCVRWGAWGVLKGRRERGRGRGREREGETRAYLSYHYLQFVPPSSSFLPPSSSFLPPFFLLLLVGTRVTPLGTQRPTDASSLTVLSVRPSADLPSAPSSAPPALALWMTVSLRLRGDRSFAYVRVEMERERERERERGREEEREKETRAYTRTARWRRDGTMDGGKSPAVQGPLYS